MNRFLAAILAVTALWWLILGQDALVHEEAGNAVAFYVGACLTAAAANYIQGKK